MVLAARRSSTAVDTAAGDTAATADPTDRNDDAEMLFAIGGMTCGACAARIERRLNRLDGVHATVNLATALARVRAAAPTTPESIAAEIVGLGYTADRQDTGAKESTSADEEPARSLRRRLLVAAVLFMPICELSIAAWFLPGLRSAFWQVVLIALSAPVVTWAALPFYTAAARALRHRTYTMDTLVSLGIVAATVWSVYSMVWQPERHDGGHFNPLLARDIPGASYLDVAAGVTAFLLAGRYFEALSRQRTGNALRALAELGAKDVAIVDADGTETRRPLSALSVGLRFVVRPGEAVATDGQVVSGTAAIDRSAMTGESLPVDVGPGDVVVGGTVAVGGRLVVRATRVGKDTQLAQMIRLVEEAQNQKASVQRLADRISSVFVPAVVAVAALTLAGWLSFGGSAQEAFGASIAVLIIACPCALGLATPTALLVASGEAARRGIFLKGYQALEASRQVDTVVLDKTGTLTSGAMSVAGIATVAGVETSSVLTWAAAVEQASEHLIARAITAAARERGSELPAVSGFASMSGLGATGEVDGRRITVGRAQLISPTASAASAELLARCADWEQSGHTVVFVACDQRLVGALALADTVRPSARGVVQDLHALGLDCVLLTGDTPQTARSVAAEVGIVDVVAGVMPSEKVDYLRRLQAEGHSVAMVGDGVNDGPALASADLGVAIGSGSDVARQAADLVIVRDDLRTVAFALHLSRRTLRTIRVNLAWAFGYNTAAIPLAAAGLLNPLIAAAAMALSSALVVSNSSRLRKVGSEYSHVGVGAGSRRTLALS